VEGGTADVSGLDERQRTNLSKLVIKASNQLFDDAERTLRGTYGILPDGTIQDEASLAPNPALRARRRTLEGVLAYLRVNGASSKGAVERLTREVAFTHLNRLLAIRVADALGVIAPSLRDGAESAGFRQWIADLAPLLATADETGGYWTYLSQCADELAVDAPALFDPRNPLLSLRPSRTAFETVVGLIADAANADLWEADDTFGWTYQFFNTKDERQQMRAESSAPRDSRELAVRNQFFTPAYVVRFLVHNTLGRRLVDADPSTPLLDQLDLLIDPPTMKGVPIDLTQVKVLDPACGSGHFLLGCYEVLEAAWQLQGVPPAEAALRILPCLWGVDIDPRAVQVAQAAVIFRARRACGRGLLPPPNIVCARALPEEDDAWAHAEAGLGPELRRLVAEIRSALQDAPILGPLLKVEQRLANEIRSTVAGADDTGDDLFAAAGITHDNFGNAERAVIAALQRAADSTTATPAERMLAARASDAVRFVEAVRNRYDTVLMNPPFGEPVPETKDYLKATYPWIPTRDYNLLAAFVGRGVELCKPEGYLGAITSRAGMFLKTFEAWRTDVMLGNQLVALADLGYGVMEEALVEAAAYAISPLEPSQNHAGVYVRLLKDADRSTGLTAAIATDRRGEEDHRVFRVANEEFAVIPGSPMAYWMDTSIRNLFLELPPLEGSGGEVRQGMATADDFRFVRLFWEVHPGHIGFSHEDSVRDKRWVPYAKGGEYSPYWSDIHLVVEWERRGEKVKEHVNGRYPYLNGNAEWVVKNEEYYFRAGLTWPLRTQGGFNPRVLPAGCAFGHKGPAVITKCSDDALVVLSGLMQRPTLFAIGALATFGSYEVGAIQRTPFVGHALERDTRTAVAVTTMNVVAEVAQEHMFNETTRLFQAPSDNLADTVGELVDVDRRHRVNRSLRILRDAEQVDALFARELGLGAEARGFLDEQLGPPVWADSPGIADGDVDHSANPLGPYLIDAELEGYAKTHDVPLDAAARAILDSEPPAEVLVNRAADVVSFLVGVAFGRWDTRGPRKVEEFDPFAPVPLCPPAMLVGEDGFPMIEAPPGYPLAIPPDGVLLDDAGHSLDVVTAVEAAARVAISNGEDLLADAVSVLGRRSLREYLAKAFFKEHLGRYSKSRRQAPVYWQLTIPSGTWSAWLYAPRFSRAMLYAVITHADRRLAAATERMRLLQDDETMTARQRQKAVDAERTVAGELGELRDDVARLAALGWHPDLDDGYVVCAAPLARWFPRNTWRQLSEQLVAIKKGAYPWAGVHEFRDAL
jgi:hypothetical protein